MRQGLSRFFSKFVFELLPAALASVIGAALLSHYGQPANRPTVVMAAPAGEETMAMLRDEHALIVEFLKQDAAKRRLAAAPAKTATATEMKIETTAESDARALAVAAAARLATHARLAAKPAPVREAKPVVIAEKKAQEPLRIATIAAAPVGPVVATMPQSTAAPQPRGVKARLRALVATVEEFPARLWSATGWIVGEPVLPRWSSLAPPLPFAATL